MRRFAALSVLLVAACTGGDTTPPTVEVLTPERGTVSDTASVTVTGTVTDDSDDVAVTVNGTPAEVSADGSFSATVELTPGVEVIETLATDGAGNTDRDVRAVMSGDLATSDGFVRDAVGARVGAAAFNVIGGVASDTVRALDLGAIAQPLNPVVDEGGSCLGVEIDVTDATLGDFTLDLTPNPGRLVLDANVADLRIDLDAHYRVACIGGSSDIVIRAAAVRLAGGLGLSNEMQASVHGLEVTIVGLDLDVGSLPDVVVDLFNDKIAEIVASTLTEMLTEKVPPMVEEALADLTGKSWTAPVLEHEIAIGVAPTAVVLDYDGAFVALDTTMRVSGGEGGVYVSNPMPMSSTMMSTDGLGVMVSDDALNQLFAGLWASGALDLAMPVDRESPISLIISAETEVLKIHMMLPPTVSMDPSGDLRLTVGDLMMTAEDASGREIMTVAMTLSTTLGAEATPDSHVQLRLGEPDAWVNIVYQEERPYPMQDADLEDLIETVFPMVSTMADHAMATMPLPTVMGVSLEDPELESRDGYLLLQTGVAY